MTKTKEKYTVISLMVAFAFDFCIELNILNIKISFSI